MLSATRSHPTRASLTGLMTRPVLGALCLLAVLTPGQVLAEPGPRAPAANSVCDHEPTALARAACSIGSAFTGLANSGLVVVAPAPSGAHVALPARATEQLAERVAAQLGITAQAEPQPLALAEAQRAASSARGLVYLSVSLYRDRIEVGADVFTGAGHFWQRVRSPGLRLKQHAVTTSPLDPELRALFPPIPLLVTRIEKASVTEHDIIALACGDIRADGSSELALVGRRKVAVGRLDQGRFAARASLNWAELSNIAASPQREPIATCSLPEPGRLWVGLSDRADALELSGGLQLEHKWHGVMPWPGGGCTRRIGLGYAGLAQACPGSSPLLATDFATPLDAFTSRSLVNRDGQIHTLRVARAVGSDSARALDSLHAEVTVPNVGAQLVIGDLDDDGSPEIVSSSPSLDRSKDQLIVRTLVDNGQLRERLRVAVPSGIDALAICPGDGQAMAPIAVVTGDGIWVIR